MGLPGEMLLEFKKAWAWSISNLAGMFLFFWIAAGTWDFDHALPGIFPEFEGMSLILILFFAVNLLWMLMILVRIWRGACWVSFGPLVLIGLLWVAVFQYDSYRFSLVVKELKRLDTYDSPYATFEDALAGRKKSP